MEGLIHILIIEIPVVLYEITLKIHCLLTSQVPVILTFDTWFYFNLCS